MIKNSSSFVIQGFMINELHLKGIELFVYAIIYGFSQGGEGYFGGSIQYLQEWTGAERETIERNLRKLCGKGLIEIIERDGKPNAYRAIC